jgi:CBS domain-containing protein
MPARASTVTIRPGENEEEDMNAQISDLPAPASGSDFTEIPLRDVMHRGVVTCTTDTPLLEVARLMTTHRIHAVVTIGDHEEGDEGRPWGVVSDHDVVAAVCSGAVKNRTAGDVGAHEVITVPTELTIAAAADLMHRHRASHLVVVDEGRPLGVVSTLDIAAAVAAGD